ncbi:MAG: glycoside hydrolase family 3 N-terminal domain-containing protein, partial [Pyrinomonadaceae bacterium]
MAILCLCSILAAAGAMMPVVTTQSQEKTADYRNRQLPVERRVADLLSRMTLEEKVAQLVCLWAGRPQVKPQTDFSTDRGDFSPAKAQMVMKNGIGQIARQRERKDPREAAIFANTVQKWLVENTRLGIPAMFHDEILHGLMAPKGTNFPTPIALASSWDTELVSQVFTAAAL